MTAPKLSVETANGRYYYHPRKPNQVPSITNIKKVRNVPAINGWKVNTTARYAADNLEMLTPLPPYERYQLIKSAPYRPSQSGDIGDTVHDWIDRTVKGFEIPEDELQAAIPAARNTFKTFLAFRRYHLYQPMVLNQAEFTVWSDTHGYAGTADLDISIGDWRVLIDNKTGNDAYWDTALQIAALAKADFIVSEDGSEQPIPAYDRFAILHLRPTYFRLIPVHHIDECFEAFLGLKKVFDTEIVYADTVLEMVQKVKTATVPLEGVTA